MNKVIAVPNMKILLRQKPCATKPHDLINISLFIRPLVGPNRPNQGKQRRIPHSYYHLFPHSPLKTELTFLLTTVQSFEFHNLIKFPTLPYSWYKSPLTYLGEFDIIKITPSKCYEIFFFSSFLNCCKFKITCQPIGTLTRTGQVVDHENVVCF